MLEMINFVFPISAFTVSSYRWGSDSDSGDDGCLEKVQGSKVQSLLLRYWAAFKGPEHFACTHPEHLLHWYLLNLFLYQIYIYLTCLLTAMYSSIPLFFLCLYCIF